MSVIASQNRLAAVAASTLRWTYTAVMMVALVILPGLRTSLSAVDTIGSKVDTIQADLDTKLDPGDARTAPLLTEANKNIKWVTYLLYVGVPLIVYGFLVPQIIVQARQNDMDAVKKGMIAVGIGTMLYFGLLIMFYG